MPPMSNIDNRNQRIPLVSKPEVNDCTWILPESDPKHPEELARQLDVSPIIASILISRGLDSPDLARRFLLSDMTIIHDPETLPDIKPAVKRIKSAIEKNEQITVYGDFDVDGVTATAILLQSLQTMGARVDHFIPMRLTDGYGLNTKAIEALGANGTSLIVTCDCGISAVDEVMFARTLGIDVIITDHHEPGEVLPEAVAVIDPKREDSDYPFKELAGVGVAFKVAHALHGNLDDVASLLDLVSIGTIADIVPLIDENRSLVREGLKLINNSPRIGLEQLVAVCGLGGQKIDSDSIAYGLGPRLNVAGRLGRADDALELLMTDDPVKASKIAEYLNSQNRERQKIEQMIFKEAVAAHELDGRHEAGDAIVLFNEQWNEGVKGIVASKMADKYYRPALIFSSRDGLMMGSARSIPGFHLHKALGRFEDLLENYGGHEYAAGLSCHPDNFEIFKDRFCEYAREELTGDLTRRTIKIDCALTPSDLTLELATQLESLEPFGCSNPRPVFYLDMVKPAGIRHLSEGRHLKFFAPGLGSVNMLYFNPAKGQAELITSGADDKSDGFIDLAFSLSLSEWRGKQRLDAKIIRVRPSLIPDADDFIDSLFANSADCLTKEEYKNIKDAEVFHTKIAGVSFDDRQDNIRSLTQGILLDIVREPENEHDANAIKVITKDGIDLGYLNARMAKQLAPCIDGGAMYEAEITDITGDADQNFGVNIEVRKKELSRLSLVLDSGHKQRQELAQLEDDAMWARVTNVFIDDAPRDKQLETWDELRSGNNCLCIMGTGRGKSAIFHVYSAIRSIRDKKITVIVYPLRALVSDQMHILRQKLEGLGLTAMQLTGDLSAQQREECLEALKNASVDIILTTPEFLGFHVDKFAAIKDRIGFFVVDEAHHICTSTESHRPLYKKLGEAIEAIGRPQILAVTATADNATARAIIDELNIAKTIIDDTVRTNLNIIDKRGCLDKNEHLEYVVNTEEKAIIYVNSREQSIELARGLRLRFGKMRNRIAYYNAGLDSAARTMIEGRFRNGDIKIVAATSAFGEGINIPDVAHVVHYHLNFNQVEFNQQSGRVGRNGQDAYIHLIFNEDDARINEMIMESCAPSKQSLAELYRAIARLGGLKGPIGPSNLDIAGTIEDISGFYTLNEQGVESGLKIFEELDLLSIRGTGMHRKICMTQDLKEKRDLELSVRFREGLDEKELFRDFKKWVFAADVDELLTAINRPIYPTPVGAESV